MEGFRRAYNHICQCHLIGLGGGLSTRCGMVGREHQGQGGQLEVGGSSCIREISQAWLRVERVLL